MSDAGRTGQCAVSLGPEDLKALHRVHLDMLIEIRRVCAELDIAFQLGGGTLLGAVRHGGFIPWDDDADIFMPRHDYDRFLREAPSRLGPGYFLQTFSTDPGHDFLYAKLRRDGTVFREIARHRHQRHHGVFVDVFPLDVARPDRWWGRLHLRAVMATRSLGTIIFAREGKVSSRHAAWKRWLGRAAHACWAFLPQSLYLSMTDRLCALLRGLDTGVVGVLTSESDLARVQGLLKPRAHMASGTSLPFEGVPFPVPAEYEAVLRQAYGDFMTLPAEQLRRPRHPICAFEIPKIDG